MSAGLAAGTFIQGVGKLQENQDGYNAAKDQQGFFEMQAQRTKLAHDRKLQLLQADQLQFNAQQTGMFAKAGISFEGSALEVMSQTKTKQQFEVFAAQQEAQYDVNAYKAKAAQAGRIADQYNDGFREALSIAGPLLSGGNSYAQATTTRGSVGSSSAGGIPT